MLVYMKVVGEEGRQEAAICLARYKVMGSHARVVHQLAQPGQFWQE